MKKRSLLTALLATTMLSSVPTVAADWDGPTTGPVAAEGKSIMVVAADLKNGGILGVTHGVEEAAAKSGWDVRGLDGAGSIQGRTVAIDQALALQPDGIVINGFDAVEQEAGLEGVVAAGIPIVAWHSGPKIGCDGPGGIFANVSTDAMTVSEAAFQRIRSGGYQTITVAEPLNLQGWQLVDKLNRAVQGEACSGHVTAPALVTKDGLDRMRDSNTFDPDIPYRDAYATIRGKM